MANVTSDDRSLGRRALILTVALFAMWGMIHNLNDILIAQFRSAFTLSDLQSSWVQSAFYFAYLVMPIPVALFLQRFGYKNGILMGLVIPAIGFLCFVPAANLTSYPAFLGALFLVACGMTFLETSGVGITVALGAPEDAEWRINLAQAFNPLGSIAGALIGSFLIFSDPESEAASALVKDSAALAAEKAAQVQAVIPPYIAIAALFGIVAVLVAMTRYPKAATEARSDSGMHGFSVLIRKPMFVFAAIAQFFYVGTQIGVWSFLIRYIRYAVPGTSLRAAGLCLTGSLFCFLIGRFASLALLRRYSCAQVCAVFAMFAAGLTAYGIVSPNFTGVVALISVSFFMSVMYPSIYAIGLNGNEDYSKPASALMIMAIIGGAVLTAAMGLISDRGTIALAYLVPLTGFLVVLACARTAISHGIVRPSATVTH